MAGVQFLFQLYAALLFDAQTLFCRFPPRLHRFVRLPTGDFPLAGFALGYDPQFHFLARTSGFLFTPGQLLGQLRHARFGGLNLLLGLEPQLLFDLFARLLLRGQPRTGEDFFFRLGLGRFPRQGRLAFLLAQFFLELAAALLGFLRLALGLFARILLGFGPFLMLGFEASAVLLFLAQAFLGFGPHGLGFLLTPGQLLFEIAQTLFGYAHLQLGFLASRVLKLLLRLQLGLGLGPTQRFFLRAVFRLVAGLAGRRFPADQFGFQFLQLLRRLGGLGLKLLFSLAGGRIAFLQLLFNQGPVFLFFADARFEVFAGLAGVLFARQQLFFEILQARGGQLGPFFYFLASLTSGLFAGLPFGFDLGAALGFLLRLTLGFFAGQTGFFLAA